MARRKADAAKEQNFEQLMTELEDNVKSLETDNKTLDESIAVFARSMQLAQLAAQQLQAAEQTVEQLSLVKGEIVNTLFEAERDVK